MTQNIFDEDTCLEDDLLTDIWINQYLDTLNEDQLRALADVLIHRADDVQREQQAQTEVYMRTSLAKVAKVKQLGSHILIEIQGNDIKRLRSVLNHYLATTKGEELKGEELLVVRVLDAIDEIVGE